NGNGDFAGNLRKFISQFSVSSDDIKNLTISALIMKMMNQTSDSQKRGILNNLLDTANSLGISGSSVQALGINPTK
ncbi:MAG: flotillin family protein, partial [Bacteroidetes bacterium]|nr:flotillin family protein [Bacteroidota bacterium]